VASLYAVNLSSCSCLIIDVYKQMCRLFNDYV